MTTRRELAARERRLRDGIEAVADDLDRAWPDQTTAFEDKLRDLLLDEDERFSAPAGELEAQRDFYRMALERLARPGNYPENVRAYARGVLNAEVPPGKEADL